MKEFNSLLELLGEELTLTLVENFAGTRVFVPTTMVKEHKLIELLGEAGLALMVQYYGGNFLPIPLARSWRIQHYLKQNLMIREIARKVNCSEAAVYKHKRGKPMSELMSMAFD